MELAVPHPPVLPQDPPTTLDVRWVASGLRARVLVPLTVGILLLIVSFALLTMVARTKRAEQEARESAATVKAMLEEHSHEAVQTMRSIMELLMRDPQLQAAFRARDRAALLRLSQPLMEGLREKNRISHLYYILPDRTMLLRAFTPEQYGDRIDRFVLQEAQRTGQPFWGHEQGPFGSYTLRVATPWRVDGELLGYFEMGIEFEHIVQDIQKTLRADVLVSIDKKYFQRDKWETAQKKRRNPVDWDEFPDVVVLSRSVAQIPPAVRSFLGQPQRARQDDAFEVPVDGRTHQALVTPLQNLRGQELGELILLTDITSAVAERRRAIATVVGLGLLVGGILAALFYALLGRVQLDVAQRSRHLREAGDKLAAEHDERLRAERELAAQQERNDLLETRSRMVEELAAANRTAQQALRENEEITAKLRETQSELLATARQAGRAEIATNVLHNVGNVLNSVNVSASVISGTLRRSRLAGLVRALAMLKEHEGDIGDFLTRDEKGRMLPGYLAAVGDALSTEHQGMAEELERLSKSLDHIKDIVATQQSHATGGHVIEPVRPADLVEDALCMQGTALARHGIEVERAFEALPQLPLDRGRVLQILVNLISNAKAAMGGLAAAERRIAVRIERPDPARLRISVTDRGEGISPENLTRIFAHGFTTRREGHGFGLHSSALAAREMGGSITARSDGPGQGATFVLELPLPPQPA